MTLPKVTVVIPVYDAEDYLAETLRSALTQDYADLEVVAVNDGSRDGSAAILEGWKDDRLIVVHQGNAGQSAAANAGIRRSSGELIKFLDQDDVLNSCHVSAQVAAMGGQGDVVASCRWAYFRGDIKSAVFSPRATDRDYADPIGWIKDTLTRDCGMMGGWQWLVPRSLLDKAGMWDERLSLENDFDFTIRILLAATGIRFAPEASLYYRKGLLTSLSAGRSRRAMESALLATEQQCRNLLARDPSTEMRRICADRFQKWLYQMYPAFPDLAHRAEGHIGELGGSTFEPRGGTIYCCLRRLLTWKQVRWLQHLAYRIGWLWVLKARGRRGSVP